MVRGVVNKHASKPVPDMSCLVALPDGSALREVTTAGGHTERVTGDDPATVRLNWKSGTVIDGK